MEQPPSSSGAEPYVEHTTSNGLDVTITAYPLDGPDAAQMRRRQLAVIVQLLEQASAEASAREA
jgi:hypothetical protein